MKKSSLGGCSLKSGGTLRWHEEGFGKLKRSNSWQKGGVIQKDKMDVWNFRTAWGRSAHWSQEGRSKIRVTIRRASCLGLNWSEFLTNLIYPESQQWGGPLQIWITHKPSGAVTAEFMLLLLLLLLQLAGTAVFAIGLWLRLDPKTKGLFEGPDAPYVFYTGKRPLLTQQLSNRPKFKRCASQFPPEPIYMYLGVYILIAAGALMMVVGFLGCCGAIQESPCMLGLVGILF